jgi:ArsR family transcriptional regulator
MNSKEMLTFKMRAEVIKAMAHPTRLFIMDKLSGGKHCVNELHEMLEVDLSTVSKHLTVLRKAGIVVATKKGTQVYYALRVPCIMNCMQCIETLIKKNAEDNLCHL